MRNRSPLVRIPDRRGIGTRCELRMPDPSANPYLALAVQLAAGLDGIERKLTPPDPVNKNIFTMSFASGASTASTSCRATAPRRSSGSKRTPSSATLSAAHLRALLERSVEEWQEYIGQVSEWELNRYLGQY